MITRTNRREVVKIVDAYSRDMDHATHGRIHKYLMANPPAEVYKRWRPGFTGKLVDPSQPPMVLKQYGLRALEFGNWVPQDERYNDLLALQIAAQDLYMITRIGSGKDKIGLGVLGVAFGARGMNAAAAHYEPMTNMINLTRSNGLSTLAHEYAHFLDFFVGGYIDRKRGSWALSGGRSWKALSDGSPARKAMATVLWRARDKRGVVARGGQGDPEPTTMWKQSFKSAYWGNPTEMWARVFEAYVAYRLDEMKIQDRFLTRLKYDNMRFYPDADDMKELEPLVTRVLVEIRKLTR